MVSYDNKENETKRTSHIDSRREGSQRKRTMVENPTTLLRRHLTRQAIHSALDSRSHTKYSTFTEEGETGPAIKAEQLTQDEIAEIQEVFSLFDKDGDGSIAAKEVGAVLRSVGFNPAEAEISKLLADFEMEANGAVDFSDFLGMMTRMERSGDTEDEIEEAFRVFDKEGNGIISAPDLRLIMTSMGEKLSEEQVEEMIQFADCEAQGEINYKELIKSLLVE